MAADHPRYHRRADLQWRMLKHLLEETNSFSRLIESITYGFSTPLLVRSPPPLPSIFLMEGHLAKSRGGKKGQIRPIIRFLCVGFQRHGLQPDSLALHHRRRIIIGRYRRLSGVKHSRCSECATYCLEDKSRKAILVLFLGSAYFLYHDFEWDSANRNCRAPGR